MSENDFDLERVVSDPEYRRQVIAMLNAAPRHAGAVAGDAAPPRSSEVGAKGSVTGDSS